MRDLLPIQEVKNHLFLNTNKRNLTRSEKDLLRDRLNRDVGAWLAKGNQIDDRGEAVNDLNHRPARAVTPGQFM